MVCIPLEWTFTAPGTYYISGIVQIDGDMDPANNETPWFEIQVYEPPPPPPPPENGPWELLPGSPYETTYVADTDLSCQFKFYYVTAIVFP
jgi:hypothetical protein